MNKVYRCQIILRTKGKVGGGSMFLRAQNEKSAEEVAKQLMLDTIKKHKYKDTEVEVKVYKSSEEEMLAHRAKMAREPKADSMVN